MPTPTSPNEGAVVVLVFRLPEGTPSREAVKLSQRLYGRTVSTWSGRYHYHRPGLLEELPHRRLGRGVLLLLARDAEKVRALLGQVRARVEVREIKPTTEDLRVLRKAAR